MDESYHQPLFPEIEGKLCRGCNEVLSFSCFSRKGPGKLQSRCKECAKAWAKRYRKENPEKHKEADLRYRDKDRERYNARHRELRNKRADKVNAGIAVWKAANPARVRQTNARSRAKNKYGIEGFVATADFIALCQQYDNRCLGCDTQDVQLTWDHIVPLSKGGSHHIDNIQPLCHACNCRKGEATIDYRREKLGISRGEEARG